MWRNGWNIIDGMLYWGSNKEKYFPLTIQVIVVFVWFSHGSVENSVNFANLDNVIEGLSNFTKCRYVYFIFVLIDKVKAKYFPQDMSIIVCA